MRKTSTQLNHGIFWSNKGVKLICSEAALLGKIKEKTTEERIG